MMLQIGLHFFQNEIFVALFGTFFYKYSKSNKIPLGLEMLVFPFLSKRVVL
jgi:hypothetical protein